MPAKKELARETRDKLHSTLSQVIARTERVDRTEDRNALVRESRPKLTVETGDLEEVREVSKIADLVGAHSVIEYWKSAPYLLNLLRGYTLPDRLQSLKRLPANELDSPILSVKRHIITKAQEKE